MSPNPAPELPKRRSRGGRKKRSNRVSGAFSSSLLYLEEPELVFAHGQSLVDPRDGLMLFGPLERARPYGIRVGVVGTRAGVEIFRSWITRIQSVVHDKSTGVARPPFLGFETIFRIPISIVPEMVAEVLEHELEVAIHTSDKHQRVYSTVGLFTDAIEKAIREEDQSVDVWFVVIPDEVHKFCRPLSTVPKDVRIESHSSMSARAAKGYVDAPALFESMNEEAVPYQYEVDFHNQLKARLLESGVLTQIVRESTLVVRDQSISERGVRDTTDFQAAIAWNISTAAFYKAGGRPWKISGIRKGVCYLGLVFKRDDTHPDPRTACCAAQMFLDSGDGLVFKGALGPWFNPVTKDFHLDKAAANELVRVAVEAYKSKFNEPPSELFVHGRANFSDDEWSGFENAVSTEKTKVVCVKIQDEPWFRLYRPVSTRPVLRGLAYKLHDRAAYLWTRGYAPRLRSYAGRGVPKALRVDISRGVADLDVVLADVLALTKLNYNACMLGDGLPVTLRFADAIGEILTAAPSIKKGVPLPFRHYI